MEEILILRLKITLGWLSGIYGSEESVSMSDNLRTSFVYLAIIHDNYMM